MQILSVGKFRSIQQCSTPRGTFSVLALDHRNNLRNALNPESPDSVTDEMLTSFKLEVVETVSPGATAVLLDPEFGAAQAITSGKLAGQTGLLVAMEETGYVGNPLARQSALLKNWTAEKTRRMGASAVKLLVYYHPDSRTASEIETLVKNVAKDCRKADIALFLEPLSYSLDPQVKKLKGNDRKRVVIETAKRLTPLGVDILKAEFPLDIDLQPDEKSWQDACEELTRASTIPWVLLSASVPFNVFLQQVNAACKAGASGVAVGRAVWQEAVSLSGKDRLEFLRATGLQRMRQVTKLCDSLGTPFTNYFTPEIIPSKWYENY